jgi:hypothetical protein
MKNTSPQKGTKCAKAGTRRDSPFLRLLRLFVANLLFRSQPGRPLPYLGLSPCRIRGSGLCWRGGHSRRWDRGIIPADRRRSTHGTASSMAGEIACQERLSSRDLSSQSSGICELLLLPHCGAIFAAIRRKDILLDKRHSLFDWVIQLPTFFGSPFGGPGDAANGVASLAWRAGQKGSQAILCSACPWSGRPFYPSGRSSARTPIAREAATARTRTQFSTTQRCASLASASGVRPAPWSTTIAMTAGRK